MYRYFIFIFLLLLKFSGFSQELTENSKISLLTINPGNELYSAFGHSAIRVVDKAQAIDFVFNYGTFDFDDPNFYAKFVHGDLNYMATVGKFKFFIKYYIQENRSVYEQELNLSLKQKNKIFNYLSWNVLPENKYYLYDFFFNNCATKLRDIFEENLEKGLKFHTKDKNLSFRNLLHQYLGEGREWNKLGIDLILGAKTDRTAKPYQYMFLPDYVMYALQETTIESETGEIPFAKPVKTLFKAKEVQNKAGILTPATVFWFVFFLFSAFTFAGIKKRRLFYFFDFVLFLSAGIAGFILFYAWFFTNHSVTGNNFNLIWLLFTHIVFAFFLFGKKKSKLYKLYLLISAGLNSLLLLFWIFLPQELNVWTIPLILTLIMRETFLFWFTINRTTQKA